MNNVARIPVDVPRSPAKRISTKKSKIQKKTFQERIKGFKEIIKRKIIKLILAISHIPENFDKNQVIGGNEAKLFHIWKTTLSNHESKLEHWQNEMKIILEDNEIILNKASKTIVITFYRIGDNKDKDIQQIFHISNLLFRRTKNMFKSAQQARDEEKRKRREISQSNSLDTIINHIGKK